MAPGVRRHHYYYYDVVVCVAENLVDEQEVTENGSSLDAAAIGMMGLVGSFIRQSVLPSREECSHCSDLHLEFVEGVQQ